MRVNLDQDFTFTNPMEYGNNVEMFKYLRFGFCLRKKYWEGLFLLSPLFKTLHEARLHNYNPGKLLQNKKNRGHCLLCKGRVSWVQSLSVCSGENEPTITHAGVSACGRQSKCRPISHPILCSWQLFITISTHCISEVHAYIVPGP